MCKQISLSLLFSIFFTPCIGMYKAIIAQLDDDSDSDKIALYDLSEELLKEYKELITEYKKTHPIWSEYKGKLVFAPGIDSIQEKIDNLLSSKNGFSISEEEKAALQEEGKFPFREVEQRLFLGINVTSKETKEKNEEMRMKVISENALMQKRISRLNDICQSLQENQNLPSDLNSILQDITIVQKKSHTYYKTLLKIIHRALFYQKHYAHYAAPVTTTVSLPTKKFQWTFEEEGKETWEEEHHAWIRFLNEQSELIEENQSLVKKFTPIECRGILDEILKIQEHYKNPKKYEKLKQILMDEIQKEASRLLKILEQEAAARSK